LITNSQIMIDVRDKIIHKELSYEIVGILYDVYNELGFGYSEKIYEIAIAKELAAKGKQFKRQASFIISYKGECVGRYYLDFIIENKIVLELKRGNYFSKKNIEQIKGYLAATKMKLAILAQFTANGVKIFRAFNPKNKC